MALNVLELFVVALAAVVPPIVYVLWIRNAELCRREQLRHVMMAFLIGAFFSLGLAYLFETAALTILFGRDGIFTRPFWSINPESAEVRLLILGCIVAPFVEELTKAAGIMIFNRQLTELENGLVYGAAVGLGFAAFENILYDSNALAVGLGSFLATAFVRALTSTALHASSSAIVGYGLARHRLIRIDGRMASWIPYYLIAVLLHSVFNLLALIGSVLNSGLITIIGLALAVLLTQQTFRFIVKRVKELDKSTC